MCLSERYAKQTAGPYDRKFMHTIDSEFEKQKWFKVEKVNRGTYEQYVYIPLDGLHKYKQYYQNYYSQENENIQYIIRTFKKRKTNDVELVATIYACWIEVIKRKEFFSEGLIINRVYDWAKEKKKFSESDIRSAIYWMRENGFAPIK